jgi:hypothetical protein
VIRLSEVAEKTTSLPFHPVVYGIGMFAILGILLLIVTRLDSDS